MDKLLYAKLYEAFVPVDATPESLAASEAADPYFDRLLKAMPLREADEIWNAAIRVGTADQENDFAHGVRLGIRLMLDVLGTEQ